jgi:hypothetical protein
MKFMLVRRYLRYSPLRNSPLRPKGEFYSTKKSLDISFGKTKLQTKTTEKPKEIKYFPLPPIYYSIMFPSSHLISGKTEQ